MTAADVSKSLDELSIDTIRTLSMDAVQKANSGHPGTPMGLAPLAYVLYTRIMRHNPGDPDWLNRDRFVLSAGHASMLLYSILYLTGYPLTLEDIENFRQLGSPTAGHPERKYSPGIEATTGPLGQGIAMAVGLALAERMLAARFNRDGHDIVDHHTFTIASDGDMQEGVASEASSLAGHLGLGRLIAYYDDNKIQLAGPTSQSFSENVAERYDAYGWHVESVGEDLSPDRLEQATRAAMAVEDRPSLIIVRSHIGFGSPHKQDTSSAHGSALGEDEVRLTKEAYGWDPDKHFYVPEEALANFRRCCERGRELESEWQQRFDAYAGEFPEQAQLLRTINAGQMPDGWDVDLPRFDPSEGPVATRVASGKSIQWAAARIPFLVGGSADLATSNNTDIEGGGEVEKGTYDGRNLRFGVREHGMGAIVNGLTLHGLRAFGGDVLDLLRLHARSRPALGADEAPLHLGLHARLDRPRRGRPYAPTDRAARRPARRAAPQRRAPGRRERDGAGLALRATQHRGADGVRALAPEPADPRPRRDPRRCDRARRLRVARRRGRGPGADPDRNRIGGIALPRGRGRPDGCARARRQHAVHGHVHQGR